MGRNFRKLLSACGAVALGATVCAAAVRRPATSEFAPDRFRLAPLAVAEVGREIPFIYDVPGVARQAKSDPRTTYETWIGLGLQALREGDFNVAVDCFRAALAKKGDVPDTVRHLLARSLLLDEHPAEAEKIWDDLCAKDPKDAEAQWQLGYSLFLRDELDGAMSHWQVLDELAPAHPYPPLMIGLVNWSLRQMPEAERQIIISTRRTKAPAQAFLAMAAIACEDGDLPEAVGWMRRGFDRLPPVEQRRWYVRSRFSFLRHAQSTLVAGLENEFGLNAEIAIDIPDKRSAGRDLDVVVEHPYDVTLDFAPMHAAAETNVVAVPEGLEMLRLAPRNPRR